MNAVKSHRNIGWALAFLMVAGEAGGALTDLSDAPLVTSGPVTVKPNVQFILDDSGSMDRDYMPDWVGNSSLAYERSNSDYNGVAYNPAVTYTKPVKYNTDGSLNTTSYKDQNSSESSAWTQVDNDGYGIQDTGTSNLVGLATYYLFEAGEYCSDKKLRNCVQQSAASVAYPYAAKLRWCTTSPIATSNSLPAAGTCQAVRVDSGGTGVTLYTYARHPFPQVATITIGGSGSTQITNVQVNGKELLSGTTAASTSTSTVASRVVTNINNCKTAQTGNCTVSGYSATRSGSVVTITAPPGVDLAGIQPTVGKSGSMTYTRTAFTTVVGKVYRVDIVGSNNSYPYPGTTAKATTRTDCAGTTCTYAEEMTNYANWWAYYRTRMQMMKTGTSIAFAPVDNSYRAGFFTINSAKSVNATGTGFLNIDTFAATQKANWYSKLFAANPGGTTPLRGALAKAGRIYAHTQSGAVDPVQYSCQQNFTILSTDGYWNIGNETSGSYGPIKATASSPANVGNPDGTAGTIMGPGTSAEVELLPRLDESDTSNTLADVAEYYYVTDLRNSSAFNNCTGALGSGSNVCLDNVPAGTADSATWQHMTTFTLGLGASGFLQFDPGYQSSNSGDFYDLGSGLASPARAPATANADHCAWLESGSTCEWPVPVVSDSGGSLPNIDDLWHAAVNGRGTYYSATDPTTLATGLESALSGIAARVGASGAATTSNPNVSANDNYVFSTTFTSVEWSGELVRQTLDVETGAVSATKDWSAQTQLDNKDYTTRNIYTYDASNGSTHLRSFVYGNLNTTEQGYFGASLTDSSLLQFCPVGTYCLSATAKADAKGVNLVNFLRGDRSQEGLKADTTKYYRQRSHVLGDIVNAETAYVKGSLFAYKDSGYDAFVTANANRQAMIYAAANDGMLHAFDATTGNELWAYIPSAVLPQLYQLADKAYSGAGKHRFFVDATPVTGDVYFAAADQWRTILVGGLGKGGKSYYALDITDPASPKALWEFTDTNLGYTFGNPLIAKLRDGTWVVMVTSGYNNTSPGNGDGRLYILNAETGVLIRQITTNGTGNNTTPNGLARITYWVDDVMHDNTAVRVYGGDLLGRLWRFDINNELGPTGYEAQEIAAFKDASGNAQPITTKPEIGEIHGVPIILVGTGRFLGSDATPTNDLNDTSTQSFYGVKDTLGTTSFGNPRTAGGFVVQTLTDGTCPADSPDSVCSGSEIVRLGSNNAVNIFTDSGWYFDFPEAGERLNTDPTLVYGTLVFNTNVPSNVACVIGGHSYKYFLNYRTGGTLMSAGGVASARLRDDLGNDAMASRPVVLGAPSGSEIWQLTRLATGKTNQSQVLIDNNTAHRSGWRQLIIH